MAIDIRQSTADPIAVDMGNVGVQGRIVSKTVQFSLFTTNKNAVWAERQHLLKSSYPFAILQLMGNRKLFKLLVGDCFKFTYPKYGINGGIFRVLQKEEAELESEDITINAIEDFYSVSRVIDEYSVPPDLMIPRPDYSIIPFVNQMTMEAPFVMTLDENPQVIPIATPESQYDLGFNAHMSIDDGSSYNEIDSLGNLLPSGVLADASYPITYTIDSDVGFVVEFRNGIGLEDIETTTWSNTLTGIKNVALLGDEIIFFKTIAPVSGTKYQISDIIRARMDTVKWEHEIGETFFMLENIMAKVSEAELVVGSTRQFKLVPYNSRRRGSLSDVIAIDQGITGRWKTPYSPTNLKVNDEGVNPRYDDDCVFTWTSRVRGHGAGVGLPGEILPETEWEGLFEVEVWVSSILKRTASGIDNITWTYTAAMNNADNGGLAAEILFKLANYRAEGAITYYSNQETITVKKN